MNVIIVTNDGNITVYGNFKTACDNEDFLNYHRDKMKKFPIRIGTDIIVEKYCVFRGRRKKNKITPTDVD